MPLINYEIETSKLSRGKYEQKTQFSSFCIITLILIICGCASEPDNVVVSSDGVKISFDVQGEGEPALVFVHGWSNNRSMWDAQVAHFSEKYKVITVDLPGFGESGNNRQIWTMSLFGQDVAAVVNKLGLKQVVLVGFSMGAPVVIEARVPHRLRWDPLTIVFWRNPEIPDIRNSRVQVMCPEML